MVRTLATCLRGAAIPSKRAIKKPIDKNALKSKPLTTSRKKKLPTGPTNRPKKWDTPSWQAQIKMFFQVVDRSQTTNNNNSNEDYANVTINTRYINLLYMLIRNYNIVHYNHSILLISHNIKQLFQPHNTINKLIKELPRVYRTQVIYLSQIKNVSDKIMILCNSRFTIELLS